MEGTPPRSLRRLTTTRAHGPRTTRLQVAIVQLVTLSLQASSKLKLYGQGATRGVVEFLRGIGNAESGYIFVRMYALFLLGLVVNAIYPAILLRTSSIRLQRELSAVTDVVRSTRHTMP